MVDDNVLGLDVAVEDVLAVEVFEGGEDLDEAVAGLVFAEALDFAEVVEELAPGAVLEGEGDEVGGLEGVVHSKDVGVVEVNHDIPLVCHNTLFSSLQQPVLLHNLERIVLPIPPLPDQKHFREP